MREQSFVPSYMGGGCRTEKRIRAGEWTIKFSKGTAEEGEIREEGGSSGPREKVSIPVRRGSGGGDTNIRRYPVS